MIRPFKFILTNHQKLHDNIMSFFERIKTDDGRFRKALFDKEFWTVIEHHPKILKEPLQKIFRYVKGLDLTKRNEFCCEVIEANDIRKICRGELVLTPFNGNLSEIQTVLKKLFFDLYKQVLDGDHFRSMINSVLRDHFDDFCKENSEITLCPFCGIGELKKEQSEARDQYDHYLPKSLYPYSAVNFFNLVPCCGECNSTRVKGDKDIITDYTGKVFYPFDEDHNGLILKVRIINDNSELNKIELGFEFESVNHCADEISAWNSIYCIESRYKDYVSARIAKWLTVFKQYKDNPKTSDWSNENILEVLAYDEAQGLNFIRVPALKGFIRDSDVSTALSQIKR